MLASLAFRTSTAGLLIAAALVASPRFAAADPPPDLPPLGGPPVGAPPAAQPAPPVAPPALSPPRPGPYGGYPAPGLVYPPGMSPGEIPPGMAVPYPMPYYYPQPPQGPRPSSYDLPEPPPRRRHDAGMFAGGVVLVGAGLVGVISGAVLVSSSANRIDIYCDSPSFPCAHMDDNARKTAGALVMAGGAIMGAVGIPLWLLGSRLVPLGKGPAGAPGQAPAPAPQRPALQPELRVGAGAATVTLRF
jgi:hypothetical protein